MSVRSRDVRAREAAADRGEFSSPPLVSGWKGGDRRLRGEVLAEFRCLGRIDNGDPIKAARGQRRAAG